MGDVGVISDDEVLMPHVSHAGPTSRRAFDGCEATMPRNRVARSSTWRHHALIAPRVYSTKAFVTTTGCLPAAVNVPCAVSWSRLARLSSDLPAAVNFISIVAVAAPEN